MTQGLSIMPGAVVPKASAWATETVTSIQVTALIVTVTANTIFFSDCFFIVVVESLKHTKHIFSGGGVF